LTVFLVTELFPIIVIVLKCNQAAPLAKAGGV